MDQLVVTQTPAALLVNFCGAAILAEEKIQQVGLELMSVVDLAVTHELPFVLSFQGVNTISSALIGKLVLLNKKARECGVRWKMCEISPSVEEVFRRLGDEGLGGVVAHRPSK